MTASTPARGTRISYRSKSPRSSARKKKERRRRRARPIPPELLRAFSEAEQKDIKDFLARLMITTEQFHHAVENKYRMDDYDVRIAKLQARRQALFENP